MKELGLEYITENSLKLFDIPLNGQLDAGRNPATKFTVKFFGQYGIEPIDDKLYVIERKYNLKPIHNTNEGGCRDVFAAQIGCASPPYLCRRYMERPT